MLQSTLKPPDSDTIVLVLLGASEYPHKPEWSNPVFRESAHAFRNYALSATGLALGSDRVLDLFDDDSHPARQLVRIKQFLASTTTVSCDLILYYVGHGHLYADEYHLAVRETQQDIEFITAIKSKELSQILREEFRHKRMYMIIDACYAASAVRDLQGDDIELLVRKMSNWLPTEGTAFLAAASKDDPAHAPRSERYTRFTGAVLDVLTAGVQSLGPKLTLFELFEEVRDNLRRLYPDALGRPELHVPRQREGDVSQLHVFPNPAYQPPATRAQSDIPAVEQLVTQRAADQTQHSRRTVPRQPAAPAKIVQQARTRWRWFAGTGVSASLLAVSVLLVYTPARDRSSTISSRDVAISMARASQASDAGIELIQVDATTADVVPVLPDTLLKTTLAELRGDLEPRLRAAAHALDGNDDLPSIAMRAILISQLAQDLQDRASVTQDTTAADALRQEARQTTLDASSAARRVLHTNGDDAIANLAMANVLRLQGKPATDIERYLSIARTGLAATWRRDLALAVGLVLMRDGNLAKAGAAFAGIDRDEDRLETSGDVRPRLHIALGLVKQGKPAGAQRLVDQILAAQPEHALAKVLVARLKTLGDQQGGRPAEHPSGESYERLVARADAMTGSNCKEAIRLYALALQRKRNGVEALVGKGFCHIDTKQFATALAEFFSALAVSPKHEPALRGVAEAYQQEGDKDQAIAAYKRYLEVYPSSAAAKKQLERLGVVQTGVAPAPERHAAVQTGVAPPPVSPFTASGQERPAASQAELAFKANEEGKELMYAEKYAEAAKKFQEAFARVHEARYLVNLCTARLQEGRYSEALTACNAVQLNNPTSDQRDRAGKLIDAIISRARNQGVILKP